MNAPTGKPVRSPSYPNMALREAINAVRTIEQHYRTSPVDRQEAARLMGYTTLSGPASKALAALASYGLVERAGRGEMRVTEGAQAILHPRDESERNKYLVIAALNPVLFQQLQDRYPGIVPPEDGVASFLSRRGFNANAIRPATKAYLQTLSYLEQMGAEYSHMDESGQLHDSVGKGDAREASSELIDEATTSNPSSSRRSSLMLERSLSAFEQDEAEWLRIKVGPDTSVRLLVRGNMSPKEIGNLIRLLEAQKLVLEDE